MVVKMYTFKTLTIDWVQRETFFNYFFCDWAKSNPVYMYLHCCTFYNTTELNKQVSKYGHVMKLQEEYSWYDVYEVRKEN